MNRLAIGLLAVALVLVFAYDRLHVAPVLPVKPDTVVQTVLKQSAAVAETTTLTVTRFKTRVDSFIRADTLSKFFHDTVFLRSLDTVFAQCERCARKLDSLRLFSDSVIKSRDDTIAALRQRLASCRGSRPWWAGVGLVVGGLSCRH